MKNLSLKLLILFIVFSSTSCMAPKQMLESPPPRILNIDNNLDKNSNYVKANEWMVETFNNAESVIQFTDKEAGIVKGKYVMKEGSVTTSAYGTNKIDPFYAIITIRVKDNASRIEIDPPSGLYSNKVMNVEYGFTPEMFNTAADSLIENFKNHMLDSNKNSDW